MGVNLGARGSLCIVFMGMLSCGRHGKGRCVMDREVRTQRKNGPFSSCDSRELSTG